MVNFWFLVVAAQNVGEEGGSEVDGPLESDGTLSFEASGLIFRWRYGEGNSELLVSDRYGDDTETGDPLQWPSHSHFVWRFFEVEDTDGVLWLIIVADSFAAAEAARDDLATMGEPWIGHPSTYRGAENESNDGLGDGDDGDVDDDDS